MVEKLRRKGFDEQLISSTIAYLHDLGMMDDEALVSDLYRITSDHKPLGKKGISLFLIKRGIEKDLVDKTLLDHTSEMEEKAALEFASRRRETLQNYPQDVIKRRLWGMLQRRGFSYDVIKRVVNSVL